MDLIPEIKPLVGFCSLEFSLLPEDAEKIFGAPDETQVLSDDILDAESYVMHYWENGFSLFFDNLDGRKFSSVEVDHEDTQLFGVRIFALNEKAITALMNENGYKLTDSETHDWGEKRLSFDNAGIDFYFENNKLQSINFGVADEDADEPAGFQYFPN